MLERKRQRIDQIYIDKGTEDAYTYECDRMNALYFQKHNITQTHDQSLYQTYRHK